MRSSGGLLLPESVLTSPWFLLLATVVAFNTLIYVGLTLAKLIPWPRQFHPSWVRRKAERIGIEMSQEAVKDQIPVPEIPESDNPYENLRLSVARRDIPQAFALAGGLILVFSTVSLLVFRQSELELLVLALVLGVGYLVLAVVLGHRDFRGRTMMRLWAGASTIAVFLLLFEGYYNDDEFPLAYALIVITAFVPVTLAWRPSMIAGAFMIAGVAVVSYAIPGVEDLRLLATSAGCLVIGAVLLRLRLRALDALAEERERSYALASTDALTGALSRRGLLSLVPGLAGTAQRTGQQVCVVYVDIVNLELANEQYGYSYGDDVLCAVTDVLRDTVRQGDLVGRWADDDFLVAGLGNRPDPDAMRQRLEGAVAMTGVALGRPPIRLAVGTAAVAPDTGTFEALVRQAYEQMSALPG